MGIFIFEGILRERWNKRGRRALKRALEKLSLKEKNRQKGPNNEKGQRQWPNEGAPNPFVQNRTQFSSLEYNEKFLKFPFYQSNEKCDRIKLNFNLGGSSFCPPETQNRIKNKTPFTKEGSSNKKGNQLTYSIQKKPPVLWIKKVLKI